MTTKNSGKLRLKKKTIAKLNQSQASSQNPTDTTITGTGDTSRIPTCHIKR